MKHIHITCILVFRARKDQKVESKNENSLPSSFNLAVPLWMLRADGAISLRLCKSWVKRDWNYVRAANGDKAVIQELHFLKLQQPVCSLPPFTASRSLDGAVDSTVAGKRARFIYATAAWANDGKKGTGGRRIERMSLRCFRIPASIPCHRTITSFRLPPVGCDKSALVAFAAEYPEIKDYARRSFIRERLHVEFYKITISRYQIQSVLILRGFIVKYLIR